MAAMGLEQANSQQLARIGAGNQIQRVNLANLNAADDTARGLEQTGFNAGTQQQYDLGNQALAVKSSALDAARATRTQAKATALGLTTDAAKEGLAATTQANQTAADRSLAGTTAGQQLTFAGQNQQLATDNAAKDKVDANLNNLQTGTANFGQGFANTAGQTAQATVSAGVEGTRGLATAAGAGNALTSTTLSGMSGGLQAAQIQNTGALGLANANTNQYNAESGAVNKAIGSLTGGKAIIPSSKKYKTNRAPVDPDAAMEGLEAARPQSYDYKPGVGTPGRRSAPWPRT